MLAELFPCPDACFSARFGTFLCLKEAHAIAAGVSSHLEARRSKQPDRVQAWDFSAAKRTVLSRICPGVFSSLLGSRVWSPCGLRRVLDAPFCLCLGPSVAARRPQTPASPRVWWIISLGIVPLVQRFLWILWNCLCCMKAPSSQMWESSSYSPGLQSPCLLFGLLYSASWLFGGGRSPCTCVRQVLLVLGSVVTARGAGT